jgi:hypothetical protein
LSVELLEVHQRRLGALSYTCATRDTTAHGDFVIATPCDDGARFTVRREASSRAVAGRHKASSRAI